MTMIALEQPAYPYYVEHFDRSFPFYANPRGQLIHRVKSAVTIFDNGEPSHISVRYWCNNGSTAGADGFAEFPPEERLLCVPCERNAVDHGQPTADELAGRHVHLGVMKPHRVCCRDIEAKN